VFERTDDTCTTGDATLALFPFRQEPPLLQMFVQHASGEYPRTGLFDDFVVVDENSVEWVDSSFQGGLKFLAAWFAPSADTTRATLASVDAEGNRLLACRADRTTDPAWEDVVVRVLGRLEGVEPVVARWRAVQNDWSEFEGALGYLRGIIDRNRGDGDERRAAQELRRRVLSVLESFWDGDLRSEQALGTVRYHGARAAAVLQDAKELCEALQSIEKSRAPGELAFASEIALKVAGRFYTIDGVGTNPFTLTMEEARTCADMVAEQLLKTILACRPETGGEDLDLRHARYHAVSAFVRLAPPPILRKGAERLLPEVESGSVGRSEHLRKFAIESATLLGGLRQTGGAWPVVPGPTAGYLVESIDSELLRYTDPPLFVTAHRYLAYQAISPTMLSSRRAKLLRDIHSTLPKEREMMQETAALRYLLYYLRQEIAAGLTLDEQTRQYLQNLDELFGEESPSDHDSDSPEQRNRRDLEELVQWL
jgi:hypothetical protein